jgi:hypothetical protein
MRRCRRRHPFPEDLSMQTAAPATPGRRKPRLLAAGAVLILIGAVVGSLSFALLPAVTRLAGHRQRLAQLQSESVGDRVRAVRTHTAEQQLDVAWAAYAPKIERVQTWLAADTLDIAVLTAFQTSIASQLSDTAPSEALDEMPPEIAGRPDFVEVRIAFRATFTDARRQIARLFARVSSVVARPHGSRLEGLEPAPLIESDAIAAQTFFATEAQLGERWQALRAVAQRAGDAAAAASDTTEQADAQEQRRSFIDVVLDR